MSIAQKFYILLCGPRLLNYVLPIVMAYLMAGTIAQKYIGLYQATHIFFSAPIVWIGIVPLPGMPIFLCLIFLNILFKLIFDSPWTKKKSGVIITHIGALLLLLGGLFTALFSSEGYIALAQGEQKKIISDYHAREFIVLNDSNEILAIIRHKNIDTGQNIALKNLPFSMDIKEVCKNCKINARENKTANHKGMAQHMRLDLAPLRNSDEENMAGLTFQIKHKKIHDIFVVIEGVQIYPSISIEGKSYKFVLRRAQTTLPFSIELLDFKKETYAGTQMAKSYQSTVLIKDGDMQWESVISMNKPLRYKGYTLFQSSFINTPQGSVSVLAVVWNVGRSFPYVSGLAMCIGLILHLLLRPKTSKNRNERHA